MRIQKVKRVRVEGINLQLEDGEIREINLVMN